MPDSSAEPMQTIRQVSESLLTRRLGQLIRASGFLLGMLATALAALLLFILISFNDKQINTEIHEFIATEYGRTLEAPDSIHLALLPWPSLQTGSASLSEADRSEIFASWQRADFELDVLALLRHRLVIRHARVDGLKLHLARGRKGIWNSADLWAGNDGNGPLALQLEGLALDHASVVLDDAISGRSQEWRELEFNTDAVQFERGGRMRLVAQLVAPDATLAGKLRLSARYRFGNTLTSGRLSGAQLHYVGDIGGLQAVDITLNAGTADWQGEAWQFAELQLGGRARHDTLAVDWSATLASANWRERLQANGISATLALQRGDLTGLTAGELRLTAPDLQPDGEGVSVAQIDGSWDFKSPGHSAFGKLRARLQHDAKLQKLDFEDLSGELSISHPSLRGGNVQASFKGQADWLLTPQAATKRGALDVTARFGKDLVHTAASLANDATAPHITARVDSKRFDLDRVLSIDLHALTLPTADQLKGWSLDGLVHADNFKAAGMQMASLNMPVKLADGALTLPDHEVRMYGGSLNGSLGYNAIKQELVGLEVLREVQLDTLLYDTKISLPLSGITNATLDVRSTGAQLQAMPERATGALRLYASNAHWVGRDLTHDMLALDAGKPAAGIAQAATALSEVAAAFKIKGPLLVVDKLTARNEALALSGTGELHYASGQMNLLLDTRVTGNDKTLAGLRNRRMSLRAQGRLMLPHIQLEAQSDATAHPAMVSR
ncbi:MAG TPA: AsmA family protein [Rhodocyclaceae bacterium]|nr:AsmA family protein [Rhodocyclaceae bacterium]